MPPTYQRSKSAQGGRKPRQPKTPQSPTRQYLGSNGSDPHPTTMPFTRLLIAEGLFAGIQVKYVKRGEKYLAPDGSSWKSYFPTGAIPTARVQASPCVTGEPEPNLYLQINESTEEILKAILTTVPSLRASLDAGFITCMKTNFYPMQRGQQTESGTRIFMNVRSEKSSRHQAAMQYFHQHLQATIPVNIYVSAITCSDRGLLKVKLCCSPADSTDTQLRPIDPSLDEKAEFDDVTPLLSKVYGLWAYSQKVDDDVIEVFDV
eukprot:scpid87142/ scgid13257/ 